MDHAFKESDQLRSMDNTKRSKLESISPKNVTINTAKERKKPRKLVRRDLGSTTAQKNEESSSERAMSTECDPSLPSRVQTLEKQYLAMSKRIDTNAREIGVLQASTKSQLPRKRPDRRQGAVQPYESVKASALKKDKSDQSGTVLNDPDGEEIEVVPRTDGTVTEQRSVALAGNYKIPLPSTLRMNDVRAIQDGLSAAGSVVSAAIRVRGGPKEEVEPREDTEATKGSEIDGSVPRSPRGWQSLLNECGKLVATAANAVGVDAAVEAKNNQSRTQTS
ncbi:hypothetical protein EJ08DRAFT_660909 [Tothia fuscella]|uniref:Uncharacterized protein n=1 Tax=Tothia fuscella TaxID=1048955 RepID=A0A9P4TYM0_9PEZI|nr:hypothetical protein EJ08DRAFT_660909 [Tothia fuscella]